MQPNLQVRDMHAGKFLQREDMEQMTHFAENTGNKQIWRTLQSKWFYPLTTQQRSIPYFHIYLWIQTMKNGKHFMLGIQLHLSFLQFSKFWPMLGWAYILSYCYQQFWWGYKTETLKALCLYPVSALAKGYWSFFIFSILFAVIKFKRHIKNVSGGQGLGREVP